MDRAATILHVDMDAFFAAVEVRRRPELRGRPVIVGGAGERGVVAAASYEARAHGVHSAMPSVRARRLCPSAVFLPGDHAHYREVSERVMATFRDFTPLVEPISLDEAFLDVTGARRLHGTGREIAERIRSRILEEEGLTCSVGVARVKFLAKLASESAKPRATPTGPRPGPGVVEVEPDREIAFLHPLPVTALWGVGPATRSKLQRLGVRTVGDLAELPLEAVVASLGKASGRHLHDLANARDPRAVEPDRAIRSVSHEETFRRDIHDRGALEIEVLRMADSVSSRLRSAGSRGRTIAVKVRFGDFRTITRSSTLPRATDSSREITRTARSLLATVDPSPGVRLLGVVASQLVDADDSGGVQLTLDDVEDDGTRTVATSTGSQADWSRAEAAVEEIRTRFGPRSVGAASLAGPDGLRVARRGDQQWGPDADG
ncbi:MAG: DNA polymerase IV [Acidimicrobiales bacterium]|nr:DNA polymerase IV [Acidimicrobiales bacterium]